MAPVLRGVSALLLDDVKRRRGGYRCMVASFVFRSHSKSNHVDNGHGSGRVMVPTLLLLKLSLVIIVLLAVSWSAWWTISMSISISDASRESVYRRYRRLQEHFVTDLADVGVLSLGLAKLKEVEFCGPEYESYVPCFNDSLEKRLCAARSLSACLVPPPTNYKVPLRWPTGKDVVWIGNVKITAQEALASGSLTKRMMMMDKDQVSFQTDSLMVDGVEDYSHQIAEMIELRNESYFNQAGVRTVLDVGCGRFVMTLYNRGKTSSNPITCFIFSFSEHHEHLPTILGERCNFVVQVRTILDVGCGYGSFGAHLFSKQLLTLCVANYEVSGSQVQMTLERGLPAIIGSFASKQLPFPSLSFDMLHCARCGIEWEQKEGLYLVEVDRLLRPGGFFVWTSPLTNTHRPSRNKENQKKWKFISEFAENLCWEMLSQQDETVVWKKTTKKNCYSSRKPGIGPPICSKGHYVESPHYHPLEFCIGGTQSRRWIPIEGRTTWPSQAKLNATELKLYGVHPDDFGEDIVNWNTVIRNYWSLLSPLIFSDHPKRPGDEDPSPPFNMLRNVMDLNTQFGGLNAALLDAGKAVWVMNVVPTTMPNYLPLILDRGFIGALHDWCEAFPTYPRTYDMLHADGLLSLEFGQSRHRCAILDLFIEMDRILRPEGWVIMRDTATLIETARPFATRLRWDARVVEVQSNSDERILICQKPLIKKLWL